MGTLDGILCVWYHVHLGFANFTVTLVTLVVSTVVLVFIRLGISLILWPSSCKIGFKLIKHLREDLFK